MYYELLKEDGFVLLKEDGYAILLEFASRKTKTRMFPDRNEFLSEHQRIGYGNYGRSVYMEHRR